MLPFVRALKMDVATIDVSIFLYEIGLCLCCWHNFEGLLITHIVQQHHNTKLCCRMGDLTLFTKSFKFCFVRRRKKKAATCSESAFWAALLIRKHCWPGNEGQKIRTRLSNVAVSNKQRNCWQPFSDSIWEKCTFYWLNKTGRERIPKRCSE